MSSSLSLSSFTLISTFGIDGGNEGPTTLFFCSAFSLLTKGGNDGPTTLLFCSAFSLLNDDGNDGPISADESLLLSLLSSSLLSLSLFCKNDGSTGPTNFFSLSLLVLSFFISSFLGILLKSEGKEGPTNFFSFSFLFIEGESLSILFSFETSVFLDFSFSYLINSVYKYFFIIK